MDDAIRLVEARVESAVEVAELEKLQVRKLDRVERLLTIAVDEHGRRPVGNEQIVRTVTQMDAQRLGHLLFAERVGLQPQQTRQPGGVRSGQQPCGRAMLVRVEMEDEKFFAPVVFPLRILNRWQQTTVKGLDG